MSDLHVSPSQQVTFLHGCMRNWAFVYIAGYAKSDNKYSERGKAVHKVCEDWTNFGKPPDISTVYGKIAQPALLHIPPPKTPGLLSERLVNWKSPRGNLFTFLKDLELPGSPVSYIWDYKTTSNLDYAHSSEELLNTDPQGVTYAAHRFFETPSCTQVHEAWLYLTANYPYRCVPSVAVHERKHCLERFDLLDQCASVMLRHRRAKTHPLAFAPGVSHCEAFGGCPFKSLCNLSITERMTALMTQQEGRTTTDFLAAIGRVAASEGLPAPGAPAPAIVSIPAPAPLPMAAPAPVVAAPAPAAPASAGQLPWLTAPAQPQPQPQAPTQPQMTMPWTQPAPVVAPPVVVPAPQPTPVAVAVPPTIPAPPPSAPAATIPDLQVEAPAAPAKRKRRTKAEMAAARAAGEQVGQEEEQEQPDMVDVGFRTFDAQAPVEETIDVESRTISAQPADHAPTCIPTFNALYKQVALSMLINPGYASLDSAAFETKVSTITTALWTVLGES